MAAARSGAAAGTVSEALQAATDALAAAAVESPRLDAELLLCSALDVDRASLATAPEAGVGPIGARSFGAMVRRRIAREPVAYILGSKGFRRLELRTDRRALIPRPETEMLVELALDLDPTTVLEVGTGCGAVALAVADELPEAEVLATDTAPAALALARENAELLGLAGRVRFESGSLPPARSFDLVLANLPYVRSDEWAALAPEIVRFEPRSALIGGADGLEPIRSLIEGLAPAGSGRGGVEAAAVGLELAPAQVGAVTELLHGAGFGSTEVRPDLSGRARVVVGRALERGA